MENAMTHDHNYRQHPRYENMVYCSTCGFAATKDLLVANGIAPSEAITKWPADCSVCGGNRMHFSDCPAAAIRQQCPNCRRNRSLHGHDAPACVRHREPVQ